MMLVVGTILRNVQKHLVGTIEARVSGVCEGSLGSSITVLGVQDGTVPVNTDKPQILSVTFPKPRRHHSYSS